MRKPARTAPRSLPNRRNAAPPQCRARAGGFTLIEVLVAVTIFAICSIALLTTFRVSTRAFQVGREATVTMQSLRFTVEVISRDLRAIFYESDYNQRFVELQYRMADQEMELLQRLADADPDSEASPDYVGLKIDMHFLGKKAGKGAYLEFAHFVGSDGTYDGAMYGAERVRYFLAGPEGTDLYRQRSSIFRAMRINPNLEEEIADAQQVRELEKNDLEKSKEDEYNPLAGVDLRKLAQGGTLPPQFQKEMLVQYMVEEEPEYEPAELLAEDVETFELKYGQFKGSWQEADSWDSDEKVERTPAFNVLPEDPHFMEKLKSYQERASDSLPASVRLKLAIRAPGADKKSKPKLFTTETVIWLPAALEVYTPGDEEIFETQFDESGNMI